LYSIRPDPAAQPPDIGGHGIRVYGVPAGSGQVAGDLVSGQWVSPAQDQQPQQGALLAADQVLGR
jgi:hypothetical protein